MQPLGLSSFLLDRGETSTGYSVTNVGSINLDSILSLELTVCDSQGDSLEASISNSFVDDGDFHVVSPDAIKW